MPAPPVPQNSRGPRLDFLDIAVSNLERLEQCARRYRMRTEALTDSFQDGKGL